MDMPVSYEMQTPKSGQLLLYVDLTELAKYHSISDGLKQLELMGYTPQLRYSQWTDEQSIAQVSLFALLRDVQGLVNAPDQSIGHEVNALNDVFPEPMVVRCSWKPMIQDAAA